MLSLIHISLSSESGLPTNVWGNITKVTENNTVLDEVQYSLDPVSYTHLDVYKRQAAAGPYTAV